jgi:hypothetical protein
MNKLTRSTVVKFTLVAGFCVFGVFLVAQARPAPSPSALQGTTASPVALHTATAVRRQQSESADDALQNEITLNGMEAGKAGFHLLRPPSDPQWTAGFSRWHATLDYRWWDVPVNYGDVEYQRLVPASIDPNPAYSPTAVVSQARVFSNSLGAATAILEPSGTYKVEFAFTARGVAALQALLEPTSPIVNGRQDDWYRVDLPVGSPPTPMVVVVVSQDLVYLPVNVQDLITATGGGPGAVVVADRLSQATANELTLRLNVQ